jgi:hypothetical protein
VSWAIFFDICGESWGEEERMSREVASSYTYVRSRASNRREGASTALCRCSFMEVAAAAAGAALMLSRHAFPSHITLHLTPRSSNKGQPNRAFGIAGCKDVVAALPSMIIPAGKEKSHHL